MFTWSLQKSISEVNLDSLKQYLEDGRTLLHILNDADDLGGLKYLCKATVRTEVVSTPITPDENEFNLIQELDTSHPVLTSFRASISGLYQGAFLEISSVG